MGILFGELLDNLNSATCATASAVDPAAYQASVNDKVLKVFYLALGQFALIYIYIVSWNLFGDRLAHRLRAKYFRSLLKQEVSFFDKLPAGEVSSRLSGDINIIKAGTSEKVGFVLGVLAMFVTAYIVAFIKYAKLAGILVSLLPAFLCMGIAGGHYVGKYSGLVSEHIAAASSVALESLSNVTVVQAFGAHARLEKRFTEKLELARKNGINKAVATAIQSGLLYFLAYSANGLAYWQGSQAIADVVGGRTQGISVGTTYTIIFILVDGKRRQFSKSGVFILTLRQAPSSSAKWPLFYKFSAPLRLPSKNLRRTSTEGPTSTEQWASTMPLLKPSTEISSSRTLPSATLRDPMSVWFRTCPSVSPRARSRRLWVCRVAASRRLPAY